MALQLILFDTITNQFRKPADEAELERIIAPLAARFGFIKHNTRLAPLAERSLIAPRPLDRLRRAADHEALVKANELIALLRESNTRLRRKLYGPDEPLPVTRGLRADPDFPLAMAALSPNDWRAQ